MVSTLAGVTSPTPVSWSKPGAGALRTRGPHGNGELCRARLDFCRIALVDSAYPLLNWALTE